MERADDPLISTQHRPPSNGHVVVDMMSVVSGQDDNLSLGYDGDGDDYRLKVCVFLC